MYKLVPGYVSTSYIHSTMLSLLEILVDTSRSSFDVFFFALRIGMQYAYAV